MLLPIATRLAAGVLLFAWTGCLGVDGEDVLHPGVQGFWIKETRFERDDNLDVFRVSEVGPKLGSWSQLAVNATDDDFKLQTSLDEGTNWSTLPVGRWFNLSQIAGEASLMEGDFIAFCDSVKERRTGFFDIISPRSDGFGLQIAGIKLVKIRSCP